MNLEDPLILETAKKQIEFEFLTYCDQKLNESYKSKKDHEKLLMSYLKLGKEISDKISNYI